MKRLYSYLAIILLLSIAATSCKKKHDTVSVVKTVPTVTIVGDQFISLHVGDPYTEAGATFVGENGQAVNITPDSGATVDVSTPGLYVLPYTRTTESQFDAGAYRYVVVTDIDNSYDLSGDYLREATGVVTEVDKLARGLYVSSNFGGSASLPITVYFAQLDDTTLVAPDQPTTDGITSAEDFTITYGADTSMSYRVISASFGTGIRTFVKQH